MEQKITDNHKENNEGAITSTALKLRAFVAGLTPTAIFKYTLATSVIIALAATIIYHTATDEKHVNIDKVETATVVLSGSDDLGGIGSDQYKAVEYAITNQSTAPAYVFIKIQMTTPGLYEVVGSSSTELDSWCRVSSAEEDNEIILAYGELGAMEPVGIGEEVVMSGRLHCLADAVMYSGLSGENLDIDVEACLIFGTAEDGSGGVAYNTGSLSLWERYLENR